MAFSIGSRSFSGTSIGSPMAFDPSYQGAVVLPMPRKLRLDPFLGDDLQCLANGVDHVDRRGVVILRWLPQ